MLPSSSRNFGWEQAKCSNDFLLSFRRYADSEARPGGSEQQSLLCSCVDDLRSQSFVSTFCQQWDKHTTRWSCRKRCSSANSHSAHLEIRTNHGAPSCGWFHPPTITISISKEKIMKKLKVMLLMAVIALGLAGAASAAQAGCSASEDCCASCSGSC